METTRQTTHLNASHHAEARGDCIQRHTCWEASNVQKRAPRRAPRWANTPPGARRGAGTGSGSVQVGSAGNITVSRVLSLAAAGARGRDRPTRASRRPARGGAHQRARPRLTLLPPNSPRRRPHTPWPWGIPPPRAAAQQALMRGHLAWRGGDASGRRGALPPPPRRPLLRTRPLARSGVRTTRPPPAGYPAAAARRTGRRRRCVGSRACG